MKYSIFALLLICSACQEEKKTDDPAVWFSPDSAKVIKNGIIFDSLPMVIGAFDAKDRVTITDSVNFSELSSTAYLGQEGDTIQFPFHPDYKEYVFWWTITTEYDYQWYHSHLYSKSKPSRNRLRREANRVTDHMGFDSSLVVLRDCKEIKLFDSAGWQGALTTFRKQFLATIK